MRHTDNEAELYSRARSHAISTPKVLIDLMKGVGDFGGLTGAHLICCDGRELHPHVTLRPSFWNVLGSQYEATEMVYSCPMLQFPIS